MKPILSFVVLIGLLAGCGKDSYAADPKDYDNDLTEEAFRFLFDRFTHSTNEVAYCIVWGYKIEPIPDRFVARFADIKRDVVSYSAVKTEIVGTNVTFRLRTDTHAVPLPVALFQVVLLPIGNDGRKTMEIAWIYKDQSKREIVAVDEDRSGLEKFSVLRDITPGASTKTEPSDAPNDGPATPVDSLDASGGGRHR